MAKDAEIRLVNEYKSNDSRYGYNSTIGGDGICGYRHTKKMREDMSKRIRGAGHPLYGKKFSEESKKKMSDSHKGIKLSEVTRQRMGAARTGSNNWRARKVVQYTLSGELVGEYVTTTQAAQAVGGWQSAISQCCLGRHKTYYGFIWRYADEQERVSA